jgi:hypothetical protein
MLCQSCRSLPVNDLRFKLLELPRYGAIVRSSAQGCDDCRFFGDAINLHMKQNEIPTWNLHSESSVDLSATWRYGWCAVLRVNDRVHKKSASTLIYTRSVQNFKQCFLVPCDPLEKSSRTKVEEWMKSCTDHGCKSNRACSAKIMIDISTNKPHIVDAMAISGQYTASSHCWDLSKMTRLLLWTKEQWKVAIVESSLSRNFQDAMRVTRVLGFYYIWIDALCISQDSPDE